MTGSTISTYVTQTVTIGSTTYPNPLTITNAGTINTTSPDGVYAGPDLSNATLVNNGGITAASDGILFYGKGANVSNTSIIQAQSTDGIDLENGGTVSNTGTAASIYGRGQGVLIDGAPGLVTNTGTISGATYYGVLLYAGGSVTNTGADAEIFGKRTAVYITRGAGFVGNSGTITATSYGVYLAAGGYIGNQNLITGGQEGVQLNGTGTVQNTGTILATGTSGHFLAGVLIERYGTVNNSSTAALISGAKYGVYVYSPRILISNEGTITGGTSTKGIGVFVNSPSVVGRATVLNTSIAAYIGGGSIGVDVHIDIGTVSNAGTIKGVSDAGVYLAAGGTVSNTGTAALIFGYNGIFFEDGQGTVTNTGTIRGVSANGVVLLDGGTISNTGTAATIYGRYVGVTALNVSVAVANAGTITSSYSGVYLEAGGSVTNTSTAALVHGKAYGVEVRRAAGHVTNAGTITGTTKEGVYLGAGGTVTNTGSIGGGTVGVKLLGSTGTLINDGTVSANDAAVVFGASTSNELIVDVGAVFNGAVEASDSAGSTNTLDLAQGQTAGAGALFGIGNQFTGFGTIDFDAGTQWTLGGNSAGLASGQIINGFTFGDTIDLAPSIQSLVARRLDSAALTETFANNTLTLFSGGVEFATLNLNELTTTNSENFEVFSDGNGGTDIVMDMPCFCTGTKILTPTGEVNVEDLQIDDTVITVRDNGPTTGRVTWTGRRSLDISRDPNPDAMHPVRIIAGAFAPGLPERDLRVSPHHALYIDGALMEAISLVNGATVIHEFETRFVTYHHFALETHDVILAEGLPAETYLETGSRKMFEGESSLALHPNFQILGDADFCAPMIREGAKLEAARAHLLARAKILGFTQTDALDVIAQSNGRTLQAA